MKIARLRLTSNRKRSDKSDAVAETEKCQPAQLGQRGDLKQLKVKSLSALLGQICDRKEFCLPFLRGCLLFFFFFFAVPYLRPDSENIPRALFHIRKV